MATAPPRAIHGGGPQGRSTLRSEDESVHGTLGWRRHPPSIAGGDQGIGAAYRAATGFSAPL